MSLPPLAVTPEGAKDDDWAATCAAVRSYCRWHVAPEVTETVTLDVAGYGPMLFLPTLRLGSVSEVRDVTGDEPRTLDGWRKTAAGMLSRPGGWPAGFSAVEVDMVHGYDECPADILAVAKAMVSVSPELASATQFQGGPFQISSPAYTTAGAASLSYAQQSVLDRYKIPYRP